LIHGRLTTRNNDDDGTYPCSRVTELLRHTHHKSYSCNGAKHRSTTLKQHNLQQRRRWYISVFSRVTELLLQCCKAQVKTQCCKADGAYLPTTARGTYNLASQHTISPHNRTLFPALAVAIARAIAVVANRRWRQQWRQRRRQQLPQLHSLPTATTS